MKKIRRAGGVVGLCYGLIGVMQIWKAVSTGLCFYRHQLWSIIGIFINVVWHDRKCAYSTRGVVIAKCGKLISKVFYERAVIANKGNEDHRVIGGIIEAVNNAFGILK
jgi:hypothetical protein